MFPVQGVVRRAAGGPVSVRMCSDDAWRCLDVVYTCCARIMLRVKVYEDVMLVECGNGLIYAECAMSSGDTDACGGSVDV